MMLGNLLGLIDPVGVARERFYSTNIPSRDFPYNLSHTKRKKFDAVALTLVSDILKEEFTKRAVRRQQVKEIALLL